jgi:hypothetical protein
MACNIGATFGAKTKKGLPDLILETLDFIRENLVAGVGFEPTTFGL